MHTQIMMLAIISKVALGPVVYVRYSHIRGIPPIDTPSGTAAGIQTSAYRPMRLGSAGAGATASMGATEAVSARAGLYFGALEDGCGRYCTGFYPGAFCSVVPHGVFLYSIALRSILRQGVALHGASLHGAILRGRAGVLGRLFHMSPRVVGVVIDDVVRLPGRWNLIPLALRGRIPEGTAAWLLIVFH